MRELSDIYEVFRHPQLPKGAPGAPLPLPKRQNSGYNRAMLTATYVQRRFQAGEVVETPIEIAVGTECTYGIGSDCYPYEVIEVRDAKTVVIRQLSSVATNQVPYGSQPNYLYLPNPDGRVEFARLVTRRGRQKWCLARPDGARAWQVEDSGSVHFGRALYKQDPHF